MKRFFTIFFFISTIAEAQDSNTHLVYDVATKTFRFLHSPFNGLSTSNYSSFILESSLLGQYWTSSLLNVSKGSATNNSLLNLSSGEYSLNILPNPSILNNSKFENFLDSSVDFFSVSKIILPSEISNKEASLFCNSSNSLGHEGIQLIRDSSRIVLSSFSNISMANYLTKDVVGSFEFQENVLSNEKGISFPIRTTLFSGSIMPANGAASDNGGMVIEKGIYQTEWQGFDNVSYARLKAGSAVQPVSFTLDPSANASGTNQEGYFIIKSMNGNQFSFGTVNSSEAIIGFDKIASTTLTLSADTIESNGIFLQNGVFKTTTLAVYNGKLNQISLGKNTVAYFESSSPNGTQIQIVNQSPSQHAFAGITLTQGDVTSRILSYSNNNTNSLFASALTIESNSPDGMVFSLSLDKNKVIGGVHFVFDSQETLTINANSVSIATAFILRGITDNEMLAIRSPEKGTLINNNTRKNLVYYNGVEWLEVIMKPIERKKKKIVSKSL